LPGDYDFIMESLTTVLGIVLLVGTVVGAGFLLALGVMLFVDRLT
jgi:hypothetical protein